jgi:cytochrome c biogenesis protein CcdA
MLQLFGLVISISLVDSLNPSTIAPALFLAGGERPRAAVAQFALGVFAVSLFGGLLLTLGPGEAILALVPKPGPTARYIGETVAGAAMLIAAPLLWRDRVRSKPRQGGAEHSRRRSPALMGAAIEAIELPTAFPYIAAIAAVVSSGYDIGRQLVLIVTYNVCFVAPLLAVVATLTYAGENGVAALARIRTFVADHWRPLAAAVALVAGVFVITLGITGLAGRAGGSVGSVSRGLRHIISH